MSSSSVEHEAGYLVKRVQQALRRACDLELKESGLSMAQYAALQALADHPEASASDLARLCFVTRQSLGELLAGLQAGGFVRLVDKPLRGRSRAVALTPAGEQCRREGRAVVDRVSSAMLEGITPRARRELADVLARCAGNLESLSPHISRPS